jgi:hypothetical protein
MNRFILFVLLFAAALAGATNSYSQKKSNAISINVTDHGAKKSKGAAEGTPLLNGYAVSVSGQTITYHSSHPDADVALLVRANTEAHSATWKTDTLPNKNPGKFYRFIWLGGFDRSGWGESNVSHVFQMFVNDSLWFTFRNYKDSTDRHWKVAGKDSAELRFDAQVADRFGDLFGYMHMNLPKKDFTAGAPLLIRVDGENGSSLEWCMTFEYRFSFIPRLRAEPALLRKGDSITQELRLSLDNLEPDRSIEIDVPGLAPVKAKLNIGANIFPFSVPAVDSARDEHIVFKINAKPVNDYSVRIDPVPRRDIYLLSYSHNDIGYTDLQPNVERKQWENLDLALRLIDSTRNYPEGSRYKWNLEGCFPLDSYLRLATEKKRNTVLDEIRSGNIGVNAFYANMLTGLANSTEMSHFTDYARSFSRQYSIPVTTALESDVPGFTWGIVTALAQSGVKYFASSPNNGDRIGFVIDSLGDKPFYWTSQSGKEKVLFWVAGASYSMFHEGTLKLLGDERILRLLRKMDQAGYPYNIINLPYTLGDNGAPDTTLSDAVRDWNNRYASPRLIIGTYRQLFEAFEQRYGSTLPTRGGDLTPYWEDGALSTAYETALSRRAVDRLIQGEALWAMTTPQAYPEADYTAAWRNVNLWDEHTWGAANSISDPDSPNVKQQWRIKRQFAVDADSLSWVLLPQQSESAMRAQGRHNWLPYQVINTGSTPCSDLVKISATERRNFGSITTDSNRAIPSQRLSTGELVFLAKDIPPLQCKDYQLRPGKPTNNGSARVSGDTVENDVLSVSVSPRTGAIDHLLWKKNGVEFVDTSKEAGLNSYIYVPGTNPDSALHLSNVKVHAGETGGLVASLIVEGDAPGCKRFSYEIRLIDGIERVDITDTFDKTAVRTPEAIHLAFPFNLPGAQVRYDVANGIVRPETDQLSGSCKNFFSVVSWVDISSVEYGITLACPDAPLIEIGSITAEHPWLTTTSSSALIYSYVMNNYWHTNYKADQEGRMQLRYSIMPHGGGFNPVQAVKFGLERREPLIIHEGVFANGGSLPQFQIAPDDVIIESIKPVSGTTSFLAYLSNPADQDKTTLLQWKDGKTRTVYLSNISAEKGTDGTNGFTVAAHGSLYLRIEATR